MTESTCKHGHSIKGDNLARACLEGGAEEHLCAVRLSIGSPQDAAPAAATQVPSLPGGENTEEET